MKHYRWPRGGSPFTSVLVLASDLDVDELYVCWSARHALFRPGAPSWVFRDPTLVPHVPRRAAE